MNERDLGVHAITAQLGREFLRDEFIEIIFDIFTDIKIQKFDESVKHVGDTFTIDNDEDFKLLCECFRSSFPYPPISFFKKLVKLKFNV